MVDESLCIIMTCVKRNTNVSIVKRRSDKINKWKKKNQTIINPSVYQACCSHRRTRSPLIRKRIIYYQVGTYILYYTILIEKK